MKLYESTASVSTGKKKGYSGFLKPEYYSQYVSWLGGMCEKTTGYTLSEFADNVESSFVNGDYKKVYRHYYYVDPTGKLQDTDTIDNTAEDTKHEEER
jgi:hypothetical protein